MMHQELYETAVNLLRQMIAIPSLSREESLVADLLGNFFSDRGLDYSRKHNNLWLSDRISDSLPNILLNSHMDTVRAVEGWSRDPFLPEIEEGKLYGLGSNDAGGPLVSLLAVFLYLREDKNRKYNLIFAATGEEEISGKQGVESVLDDLGEIDLGLVGEPTGMHMAVAEKGLMVIDAISEGVSAHAATGGGSNAIYNLLPDIEWIRNFAFEKESEWLGKVMMQVTKIEGGQQHNVVPDVCRFIIDVRTNECYTNPEVFGIIREHLSAGIKARSFRLNPSMISLDHPLVKKGVSLGMKMVGSNTLSDQALMNFPTVKIGPGNSGRSHTADEFIMLEEIREAIGTYIRLFDGLKI